MAKLIDWIREETDEEVTAVIFGEVYKYRYWNEDDTEDKNPPAGVVMTLEEAMPWLEKEFDDGYGAPECPAMAAYTDNLIISVYQYDGSTSAFTIQRNPINGIKPCMPGG